MITVVAPYPGAGASDVAAQVAEPIEQAIKGVPRLEKLQSTSANSVALVVAQFAFGTDVKEATSTIEANIAKAGLPANVEPTVQALNINASPVIVASIAATNPDGLDEAAAIANDVILPQIRGLDGVASADLTGGLEPQIFVTLDPTRMAEAGVTNQQVIGILTANNLTLPSGQLPAEGQKIPVSTIGELNSVEEIQGLLVGVKQPQAVPGATPDPAAPPAIPTPVFLKDVATVELQDVATTGYARTNGQPALTLTVTKTSNGNTVDVAREVNDVLDER